MNSTDSVSELIDKLKERKFWIYGAGYVAGVFWQSLEKYDVCKNAAGFIVSKKDKDMFYGIKVREIDEELCIEDELICIAVHESNRDDVIETLQNRGLNNYIFIYPYLWNLRMGVPQRCGIKIKVNDLVKSNLLDYKIVIRYLALEQYFGKNEVGYDFYVRAFSNYVDQQTARKRLCKYIEFISQWKSGSRIVKENIKLNNNNQIIDGHHRVVLALYFGLETIDCDIYDLQELPEGICGSNAAMTENSLCTVFDRKEMGILMQYRKRLLLENGENG